MRRVLILSLVILIVAFLVLFRIFTNKGSKKSDGPAELNPAVPVEVYITRDTAVIYKLSTIGSLRANESTAIVSEISKKVTGIFLKEGSSVSKGQLLFKLDDADITARINKLEIEEKLAVTNESRQKAQLAKGGISQEQYDELPYPSRKTGDRLKLADEKHGALL
jgi:membrane fusion protein (multidrug efflux system)